MLTYQEGRKQPTSYSCIELIIMQFFPVSIVKVYNQSVYKQIALEWQMAKQLSGLNHFHQATIKSAD